MPPVSIMAQINSMNKGKTSSQVKNIPGNPIIQSGLGTQTMQNKQQSASSSKNMTSMGAKTMLNYPVPKKILPFSRKPKLNLQQARYTKVLPIRYPQPKTKQYGVAATGSVGKSEQAVRLSSTDAKQKGVSAISSAGNQNLAAEFALLGLSTKNYQGGPKAHYALTNNISGWASNPTYAIKPAGPGPGSKPDPAWNCVTTLESVTAQSTSFMNASKNENGQHLYPGAIYSFDDYAGGNWNAYEKGLNPMEIYTNMRADKNSFTVQTPNSSTIHQAISNITSQFAADQGGATVLQQTLYSDNLTDLSIAISAGGAYDGYSGSDTYNHDESQHHVYITLDVIKSLYTISVQKPSNGEYFADGQIPNANSTLVMIQDVTYGARLLCNIDITISDKTDMNKFQFAYNAIAANGFANVDALAHDASITYKINAYMVGVPSSTGIITTLNDFQTQVNNIFSQSNFRNAVPIQYSFTDLDGNYLGVESMTDQFPVRNCTPAPDVFTLQAAYLVIQTGNDGKNDDTEFDLYMYAGNAFGMFMNNYNAYTNKIPLNAQLAFTHTNSTSSDPYTPTMDDFKSGTAIDMQLDVPIGFLHATRDDWDITVMKLKFNFISQKGTTLQKEIDIPGFRLSSDSGINFYIDGNFNLIQ